MENATYISELDPTSPSSRTEPRYLIGAQLRMIKSVLRNSFPNVAGAVTVTDTELNLMVGASVGAAFAAGVKTFFEAATAPTGWTQDTTLHDRVIRIVSGAGGGTGGSWTLSGISVDDHTLTVAEMYPHTHSLGSGGSHSHYWLGRHPERSEILSPGNYIFAEDGCGTTTLLTWSSAGDHTHTLSSTGGGQGHNHGLTIGSSWRPAYTDIIACSKDA